MPEVLSQGEIIEQASNWKGRGYDTVALAAPIAIAGQEHVVFAVIEQKEKNKFYVHEVLPVVMKSDGSFLIPRTKNKNCLGEPSDIFRIAEKYFKSKQKDTDTSFSLGKQTNIQITHEQYQQVVKEGIDQVTVYKIINTDYIRGLIPDYAEANPLTRDKEYHALASKINKEVMAAAIEQLQDNAKVMLLAGGGGSGKGSASSILGFDEDLTLDTTFSGPGLSYDMYHKALGRDKDLLLAYVFTEFKNAFPRIISRFKGDEDPRLVPLSVVVDAHIGAQQNVLAEAANPNVVVIDNNGAQGQEKVIDFATLKQYDYLDDRREQTKSKGKTTSRQHEEIQPAQSRRKERNSTQEQGAEDSTEKAEPQRGSRGEAFARARQRLIAEGEQILKEHVADGKITQQEANAFLELGDSSFSIGSENRFNTVIDYLAGKSSNVEQVNSVYQVVLAKLQAIQTKHGNNSLSESASKEEKLKNQLVEIRQSLAVLKAIESSLPIELRGKIGGYKTLAELGSPEAQNKYLINKVDKMVEVLNKHVKDIAITRTEKIFKGAKIKKNKKGIPQSRLPAEHTAKLNEAKAISQLSNEQVQEKINTLVEDLAGLESQPEVNEEKIAEVEDKIVLLQAFGDLKSKDIVGAITAWENATTLLHDGVMLKNIIDEAARDKNTKLKKIANNDITGGKGSMSPEDKKNKSQRDGLIPGFHHKSLSYEYLLNAATRANKNLATLEGDFIKHFSRQVHLATHNENRDNQSFGQELNKTIGIIHEEKSKRKIYQIISKHWKQSSLAQHSNSAKCRFFYLQIIVIFLLLFNNR